MGKPKVKMKVKMNDPRIPKEVKKKVFTEKLMELDDKVVRPRLGSAQPFIIRQYFIVRKLVITPNGEREEKSIGYRKIGSNNR